jgi:hypothetical protein
MLSLGLLHGETRPHKPVALLELRASMLNTELVEGAIDLLLSVLAEMYLR